MESFFAVFKAYLFEMFPYLALGLLISGIVHECIPDDWVERYLGGRGLRPIILATLISSIAPVCCWGSLPIALSFRKKGASLGPVFSILTATPASSVGALCVTWKFMGPKFTVFIFFAVIVIGFLMGLVGNLFSIKRQAGKAGAGGVEEPKSCHCCSGKKTFWGRVRSVFKYAFWDMPREIGLQLVIGLVLAAVVESYSPVGMWINSYLSGGLGYVFALLYGLIVYMCATCSIPMVHALMGQGLNVGAGMALLMLGPVVSWPLVMVLRREFGVNVLVVFVVSISFLCLFMGYLYELIV